MVDAPFDAYLDTPNKSIRQNVPRKGVCLHHAAMTSLSGLESLAMGGKQVSATAIAKDRISKRLMTDAFRAWSLSSAWGDSSFRSVETCNQSTDGWTISDESHWELANLVAYWATIDGFWPHREGDPKTWTVVGHREMFTIWGVSYATACPGGMDLDLVTRRAQAILNGSAPAGLNTNPLEDDMRDALLYRNQDNGDFRIMNPETGLEVGISHPDYLTLYIARGWFPGVTSADPINLAGNEFAHLQSICASVRGGVAVDTGAIAAAVGGQVTSTVKATLLEALEGIDLGDVDVEALAGKVADRTEARLADDFAKVNANIDDQPTTFEVTPKP